MNSFFDPMLFKIRLSETIHWCNQQLQDTVNSSMLRTLLPTPPNMVDMHQDDELLRHFANQIFAEREKRVQHHDRINNYHLPVDLTKGEIVIFLADNVFAWDGVAETYSKGYFDLNGFPAWDCWVYHVTYQEMKQEGLERASNHIISWVPLQFVEYVKEAIAFNPDDAIVMLEDAKKFLNYLEIVDDLIE